MNPNTKQLWLALICLNILDAFTTYIGIKYLGMIEANPYAIFINTLVFPYWILAGKITTIPIVFIIFSFLKEKIVMVYLSIVNILFMLVVIWNTYLIYLKGA